MAQVPKQITKEHILNTLYNIEVWCRYVRAVLHKSDARIIVERDGISGPGDIDIPPEIWDCPPPDDIGAAEIWDCPGEYSEGEECEESDEKEKKKKEKKEKKEKLKKKKKKPKKKKR
jgi:hypothetical protein